MQNKISKNKKKKRTKKYCIVVKTMFDGLEIYKSEGIRKGLDELFGSNMWDIVSPPIPILNDKNYFVFIGYKEPEKAVNCRYKYGGKEYVLYDDFAIIGCNIKKQRYCALTRNQVRRLKKIFPSPIKKNWSEL